MQALSRNSKGRASLTVSVLTIVGLAFSGCVVGPNYKAPAPVTQMRAWPASALRAKAGAARLLARPVVADTWWTTFKDAELNKLVGEALKASPTIAISVERVRAVRAEMGIVSGGRYPSIGIGAGRMEYRHAGPLNTVDPGSYSTYRVGFDSSWEIDLWGGTRRTVESAGAVYQAAEEDARGVRLSLAAEVARTYVALRATQERLVIARRNLALQRHMLALTQERLAAGVTSDLDVSRATGQVANTESLLPLLENGIERATRRLAILVGKEPNALEAELAPVAAIPGPPDSISVGLPADLLRHRPDIRAAERRIQAANARIGAARAQLYPHFDLVGMLGFVSTSGSGWLDYSNRYYGFGPGIKWSLLNGGRVHAEVDLATARTGMAYAQYRQVVLTALDEAENALGTFRADEERHHSLEKAEGAARKSVATASELYREGVTDFLSVIDAQRALAAAQDNLARNDQAVSTDLIALFKALGGGWRSMQPNTSYKSQL